MLQIPLRNLLQDGRKYNSKMAWKPLWICLYFLHFPNEYSKEMNKYVFHR